MAARLEALPFVGGLRGRLKQPEQPGLSLYWLGQAGFLLRGAGLIVLIDPYLSDSLAEKYRGTPLPHRRMMPSPIALEELGAPDLILCTHHHTDHMDPGTLAPLLARWPGLRLVAPRAKLTEAAARSGVGAERIITMDAGESIEPLPGLVIRAIRAAHETLERDPAGAHVFLGYCLTLGGATVVHIRGYGAFSGPGRGDARPRRGPRFVSRQRPLGSACGTTGPGQFLPGRGYRHGDRRGNSGDARPSLWHVRFQYRAAQPYRSSGVRAPPPHLSPTCGSWCGISPVRDMLSHDIVKPLRHLSCVYPVATR
ncbi:MBL fold metallo-hydrolase, partial [Acidisoma sp. S159]|uniref:MBL fold metallo-hydrolase n=1 Tax=Acidisoma sp. S159 TaxID=1747225 RepID=UPI001C206A94